MQMLAPSATSPIFRPLALDSQMGHKTVIGGYLSPVHEKYGKASLAAMHHRVNMLGKEQKLAGFCSPPNV